MAIITAIITATATTMVTIMVIETMAIITIIISTETNITTDIINITTDIINIITDITVRHIHQARMHHLLAHGLL